MASVSKSDARCTFDGPVPNQSANASAQALQPPAGKFRSTHQTNEHDSEKQESSKLPVGGGMISLRSVILLLVFANVAVLAVITVTIGSITNNNSISSALNQSSKSISDLAKARQVDSSTQIANAITKQILRNPFTSHARTEEFLTEASSFLFAISNGFSDGVVSLQNLDAFVPYLKATFDTVGVKEKIKACSIASFTPGLPIGFGLVHEFGRADYVWMSGGTNLSSCPKTCPTATTSGLITMPVASTVVAPPAFVFPFRKVLLEAPSVAIGQILQVLSMGLYDPIGNLVGAVFERFTVQDLCGVLDIAKNSSTPNTLFYILTPSAEVLAMSGLGSWDQQQQTLTKLVDPATGNYILKTIWTSAIYKYAGGQLDSSFADKQFYVQRYLFQVTTLPFEGFKYIIVSGAPDTDYLGDTITLSDNLMTTGRTAQAIMIASGIVRLSFLATVGKPCFNHATVIYGILAVAVALVMGITSVAFTYYFVDHPLARILDAMKKATKFDFSSIRDGTMKRASIVREINNTQGNFVAMLEVFANALKQNKSLVGKATGSKSVSDVPEKSLESFSLNGPKRPIGNTSASQL
ncbi:hypothetical protein M427DRAFT_43782 [Gonapodya prolifera JEL478]|uniref:Uncharacterized protein n=1 Tax=Gonapodya prolifera (strain JEL478) TaxID=1344416 RepID=A0A139AHZ5_GONPJ|nr:hypothetical protein M427DRAFT_43782 [Gonapodya prolifera JEL478]|eukprot:KXS16358.1 hypothetical protein M427DRAFT_43782 [Gonapodya prolifera JEL478]